MRFTLLCPALDAEVDGGDAANEGYSRPRVIELLDALRERQRWPYEILENARHDELERFYRDEAIPAAVHHGLPLEPIFAADASRFGTTVPALIAYDAAGAGVGVYPSRGPSGETRTIVGYLETLLHETA